MLAALVVMTLLVGFLLGVITVAGVFAYLVRQNEMEKRLDVDMPRKTPTDEAEDIVIGMHRALTQQ